MIGFLSEATPAGVVQLARHPVTGAWYTNREGTWYQTAIPNSRHAGQAEAIFWENVRKHAEVVAWPEGARVGT